MNILKHFLDNLVVALCYITLIVCPLFVILNIVNVCAFSNGLLDLLAIIVAAVLFFISKAAVHDARRAHHRGERFLW